MADSCQQQASQKVQGAFYRAFYSWGHLVGRRPCTVIWVTLLVAIAASARLILSFAGNALPSETEQDKLWVPQDAEAVDDKGRYDAIFNNTFRRNTMYFTTKPPGGNVLTSPILAEIRRFDLLVTQQLNATAFESGADGEALVDERGNAAVTYNDVCARSSIVLGRNLSDPDDEGGIPCVLFGHPFEAFYRIGGGVPRAPLWLPGDFNFDFTDAEINAILTAGRGPDKTLFPDSSNRTVNVQASYGGIERDPTTNAIVSAKSVSLTYLLGEHLDGTDERNAAIAWEDQLNSLVGSEWTEDCLSEG